MRWVSEMFVWEQEHGVTGANLSTYSRIISTKSAASVSVLYSKFKKPGHPDVLLIAK